jgi:hypothetical protein
MIHGGARMRLGRFGWVVPVMATATACGGRLDGNGASDTVVDGASNGMALLNACGGTAPLVFDRGPAQPGDPCGPCRDGALVCGSAHQLECFGSLPASVCADATLGSSQADGSTDAPLESEAAPPDAHADFSEDVTSDAPAFEGGTGWLPADAGTVASWQDAGAATVRCLNLPTNDLVLDPVRTVVYASVPSTAITYGNSVLRIDPPSATPTGTVVVGSQPGALAISDDGSLLYVGLNGSDSVLAMDLASGYTGPSVDLGASSVGGRTAGQIRVVPGSPNRYVVSRRQGSQSDFGGLAVYDGTTLIGEWNGFVGGESITFVTPTLLYGFNNETSGDDLVRFTVNSAGITEGTDLMTFILGANSITSQGGWVFANNGQTVDGATMRLVGQYSAYGTVWPSPDGANVWFLAAPVPGYPGPSVPTLEDFDRTTFLLHRSIGLPASTVPLNTFPASLFGWSSSGFAFRTTTSVCSVRVGP